MPMRWLTDTPIRRKLILITVLANAIALLLAGSIIVVYDIVKYRAQKTQELSVQAQILSASVTASLVFNDPKATQEYLGALAASPDITTAGVYAGDGTLFASYARPGAIGQPLPPRAEPQGQRFEGDDLVISRAVSERQQQVGTVYLRASTLPLATRLQRYGGIILMVMVGSLLITLPISMRLHTVISNPIDQMAAAARRIAVGDLTVTMTWPRQADEIGVLMESFSQMLENLREVMGRLGESVQVLGSSSSEIAAKATQVALSTSEMAAAVQQTTTTVEAVKQTAQVSSQKAGYVSETAQRSVRVSEAGQRSVQEMIEGMARIREQMEAITDSVMKLSEQGQSIGEIIATVSDLAVQSNLLAVNASIEAAKAGEQGKGFAVVAQEVRNLAEQSKQATAQVRQILMEIQKATQTAVIAAQQGSKGVEAGERRATEAGEAIHALGKSITEASQAAMQITASSQQQVVGMDQVALAMESIKQASAQNAAGAKLAETTAQSLYELGQRLKRLMERYRV